MMTPEALAAACDAKYRAEVVRRTGKRQACYRQLQMLLTVAMIDGKAEGTAALWPDRWYGEYVGGLLKLQAARTSALRSAVVNRIIVGRLNPCK